MKYVIVGPLGRVREVLDEPTDTTVEITDAQAALVQEGTYWILDGEFLSEEEARPILAARNRARLEAERAEAERAEAEILEAQRAATKQAQMDQRRAERIAAMSDEERDVYESRLANQAAFDAATAIFESLSKGKQALWQPVRERVGKALLSGDFAEALEIIETMPILYSGAEDDRDLFLALFPA